jgi:pimeloyl-ACP methyl ester carboxylesterase
LLRRSYAIGLLAILCGACASPVGIRVSDPLEVQRYLTRNALTVGTPSDFSLNQLRRYDLMDAFKDDPEATLARLHSVAETQGFPSDTLFALAELSFLEAEDRSEEQWYVASAIYAYAFLFPGDGRAPLEELDPRQRVAADLYNRALALAFRRTEQGVLALEPPRERPLPFGRLTIELPPDALVKDGCELFDLEPVSELEVWGLRNRYRRPGIGAPLAAKCRPLPDVVQPVALPHSARLPLTALVRFESPIAELKTGELHGRFDLFSTLEVDSVEIDGQAVPLEAEPTAALAAGLTESQFWSKEFQGFLGNALGVKAPSALYGLRPYKKGRIPAVFVHGTASSPARWADMVNDLVADPRLRDRYAYWFFTYDSGNPVVYSAYQLRAALKKAVALIDPEGSDPCVQDMIVLGHSQGGLLTKLTSIDSGNAYWSNFSSLPFDQVEFTPKDKELLSEALFVKPLPFVREIIFLATPHHGSYLAGPAFVRRLARYVVRLPSDLARIGGTLATMPAHGGAKLALDTLPTSIDNMSPGNSFIQTTAGIPVDPRVTAHSIIAVNDDLPLDEAGDGVVKYKSAHIEGVASELVVKSPHSGMQAAPETIEEVRRIFLNHSATSACPVPVERPAAP